MERARLLTDELRKAGVPQAVFFCNMPDREPDGLERLKHFANAGHLIANHTSNHSGINKIGADAFIKEIDDADRELRSLPNFRKWLRFPFLHEGKTRQDVEAVRAHLNKIGYAQGYVTIDTQDWYMDDVLGRVAAAGRKFNKKRLCAAYRDMLLDDAEMFDKMSLAVIGRSVRHTILLHETDLNAYCIGTVVAGFKARGWSFISTDLAYQDPLAQMEPPSTAKLNQGRLFALAKEAGYKGPYFTKWIEEENIEKEFIRRKVWE